MKKIAMYSLSLLILSCSMQTEKKQNAHDGVIEVKEVDSNQNLENKFVVDGLEFKMVNSDTNIALESGFTTLCPDGYNKIGNESYVEENKLMRKMVRKLSYTGNVLNLLTSGSFYLKLYRQITGISNATEEMEGLKFKRVVKIKIEDYGDCFLSELVFATPSASNQGHAFIIVNPALNEASLWEYSNLLFSDKDHSYFVADLKVRNYKHTLSVIRYNKKLGSFLVNCYKTVTNETE